jgi:hypothetical protein
MPFLDAKALETDPEGMAFLRCVIRQRPNREAQAEAPAAEPTSQHPIDTDLASDESAAPAAAPQRTPLPVE